MLVLLAWLLAEIPLVLAGMHLGKKWGHPEGGFWCPLLMGLLGFVIFVTGSHPATQPRRLRGAYRQREMP